MGDLLVGEVAGDDADDGAFVLEDGVGDLAHQADVTAAVDEVDVALGEQFSQRSGGFGVLGFGPVGGTAIDGDGFHVGESGSGGGGLQPPSLVLCVEHGG